jgi:rare lipoprotein A
MKKIFFLLPVLCLLLSSNGCSNILHNDTTKPYKRITGKKRGTQRPYVIKHHTYYPIPSSEGYNEKGLASWYGKKFHGRKTANGETYDMYGHTAAHKTLPMGTMLLVKNISNGKSTVVRINDRGPFVRDRIIDLTKSAAQELDIIKNGTARVEIIALGEERKEPEKKKEKGKSADKKRRKLIHQDFDKGKFYIQIGAFEYKKNARKLAEAFAAKGKNIIIQQFPAAGISLYRVMVFSGTSLKEARKYEAYLEQNGFPDALVIARDQG